MFSGRYALYPYQVRPSLLAVAIGLSSRDNRDIKRRQVRPGQKLGLSTCGEGQALAVDEVNLVVKRAHADAGQLADAVEGHLVHKRLEDVFVLVG